VPRVQYEWTEVGMKEKIGGRKRAKENQIIKLNFYVARLLV
jgi:hypothetical protein